jgi:hypothetical protein
MVQPAGQQDPHTGPQTRPHRHRHVPPVAHARCMQGMSTPAGQQDPVGWLAAAAAQVSSWRLGGGWVAVEWGLGVGWVAVGAWLGLARGGRGPGRLVAAGWRLGGCWWRLGGVWWWLVVVGWRLGGAGGPGWGRLRPVEGWGQD